MLIVKDVLISDDLVTEQFHCALEACKGACCWEGDYGAPLEDEEIDLIEKALEKIKPYLSPKSIDLLAQSGFSEYYREIDETGTILHPDGACVFLTKSKDGGFRCGIELAWEAEEIGFRKPISCHLYPIRRKSNPELGFDALNYDRWDICNAACNLGKEMKIPLYKFCKSAIIRVYGIEFYDELESAADFILSQKQVK